MEFISKWSYYLCLTFTAVLGFPELRKQSSSIREVTKYCDSVALKNIMDDYKLPVLNFLSDMRSEDSRTIGDDYLKTFAGDDVSNIKSEILNNELLKPGQIHEIESQLFEIDIYQKILGEYSRSRKDCLLRYTDVNLDDSDESVMDILGLMDADHFTNDDLKTLLSREAASDIVTVKKAKLGLNPTGWRKRRSGSQEQERVQQYLENMRQLLEKRERRLEFNPTGW